MPLQIPLMTFLMLALAASTVVASKHVPVQQPGYAVVGTASQATPYGSGAALRNLLF